MEREREDGENTEVNVVLAFDFGVEEREHMFKDTSNRRRPHPSRLSAMTPTRIRRNPQ